ncbi:MAG TPA: hypothetical protein VG013_26580 [Gemmataceae bacterium]|nr:hypothetical protein [Gemmataceae bacterium]
MREMEAETRKKEALRIQAAAVAAQQAALTEEEIRLQHRRGALERQEAQLVAHLEEKRRRLVEVRDQVREAHAALKQERAVYEQRVEDTTGYLAEARAELEDSQQQAQTERRRLSQLRKRLKQRWHRHWAAERAAMRQKYDALAGERRVLEAEYEGLEQEKAAFDKVRLRLNGELELGRRQLQGEWEQLWQAQQQLQETRERDRAELEERARVLGEREIVLGQSERELAEERRHWQAMRLDLQKEAEGLETRIGNQRRKLLQQEADVILLEVAARKVQDRSPEAGGEAAAYTEPSGTFVQFRPPLVEQQREQLRQVESDLQLRMVALEKLSCELADQRLHLIEQCERLAWTEQRWCQDRDATAAELVVLGFRLQEREQAVLVKEQAVQAEEAACRQRQDEAACTRRYLESWQARLTARAVLWEGDRDRQLADLQARELLADRRLKVWTGLGQRWQQRRQQELERLRAEYAACRKLRQEYAAVRAEYLRRAAVVDKTRQALAERIEMMKRLQESPAAVTEAEDARQLQRFQRRLTAISDAAGQVLQRERLALAAEATRLEQRYSQVHDYAERVLLLETDLAKRQTTWEQERVSTDGEQDKLRQDVQRMQAQRAIHENQVGELTDEVERLARLLFEYTDTDTRPTAQAA